MAYGWGLVASRILAVAVAEFISYFDGFLVIVNPAQQ